ncbi:MAG: SDR family NAD(P)-dependent oxidoreductase [Bacillota bacterium]
MNLGIKEKCALVTGASRGLGRAVALELAQEGAKVAVVARDNSLLSSVVKDMGGEVSGHVGIPLDLTSEGAAEFLNKRLRNDFGPVQIIVHNLGGTLGIRDCLSTIEEYLKVWNFNLGVAIELNRLLVPTMKENRWGRIVHISSSSAVNVDASLPYSISKAALNAYVKGLGRQLAREGIVVSSVMPGPFEFAGGHWDNVKKDNPQRYYKFIEEKMAIGRLGTPEEISGIVAYLCSEKASLLVGSVLPVDGGFS